MSDTPAQGASSSDTNSLEGQVDMTKPRDTDKDSKAVESPAPQYSEAAAADPNDGEVTQNEVLPEGNPNDPTQKVDTGQFVASPEESYLARADALNAGKPFRVLVHALDGVDDNGYPKFKDQEYSYDTKKEQEEAADFFTAWLFQGVSPRRDSLEGGALVVVSGERPA